MKSKLVQEFEELWESSDSIPDVFEFLKQIDDSGDDEILCVLLADQSRRWKTKQPLIVEDYLRRIPGLNSDPDAEIRLFAGEARARRQADIDAGQRDPSLDSNATEGGLSVMAIDDDDGFKLRPDGNIEDPSGILNSSLTRGGVSNTAIDEDDSFKLRSDFTRTHTPTDEGICDDKMQLGRYRLVRLLGEGSFGQVFLGFDEELQRQVAIKVPKPERFRKLEDADAYLAEARTVASLSHPNIVPVYDTGRNADGSIYVVSKFIEGCTLAERFRQDPPGYEEVAEILTIVARALDHAHQKGLIHRDVKPGNILLEERTGTPYVADFGLAISEENYLKERRISGTPAYMSPEQARGEGHRLDRRSDIFSLGMVMFELLSGKKPFRGSTTYELMHQIISFDAPHPRDFDDSIPAELERICMKAMAKQASDRYSTAADLADDLMHWNQSPDQGANELQIVPKGLRSFDAGDSEFFPGLLPGPRNRSGLPESIDFWKTRIEETDPDNTFSVGLIYGPSGCGKSSLVKAGLIPHLSKNVTTVYAEASPDETESRILRALRKRIPDLPPEASLMQTLKLLRRKQTGKVVIVLDQFEQWLHAFRAEDGTELVAALRQCDGGKLQTIVMVRDDFAMAAARFMDALDIPIVQGENFAIVDLFDIDHAEKVIIKFGQAFGKLPAQTGKFSADQKEFVSTVAAGLAQDGKVVSVRLALFAEMVKGKTWTPATLNEVGGTDGIGVNFLEETFASRSANPTHRLHQQAAREILKALLPEVDSDIKGHMRSHSDLLRVSSYENQPGNFNDLFRILDGELRLITPTDAMDSQTESGSDPDSKFYQLTHDYLVTSLREWLTRKQIETRRGRAELRLEERSALWNAKPENRRLPSLLEWSGIRTLTDKKKWSGAERELMKSAGRFYGIRSGIVAVVMVALAVAGLTIRGSIEKSRQQLVEQKRQEQSDAEASRIVDGLLHADTSQIITIIQNKLPEYRQWADDDLRAAFTSLPDDANGKLHAALAILPADNSVLPFLEKRLLTVSPVQFQPVRTLLDEYKSELIPGYWVIARDAQQDAGLRFQAAAALASYDSPNEYWQDKDFGKFIANHLVSVLPSELLPWRNAFSPVKEQLTAHLASVYRDENEGEQVRSFATDTLADYLGDDTAGLFHLLVDANQKQFGSMFGKLIAHREQAIDLGHREIAEVVPFDSTDSSKDALAIRQANAAIMLLRMNRPEQVWPLLKQSHDPRVRSYVVNWMIARGCDPKMIQARYQEESDVTVKRALLLSLGNLDESRLRQDVWQSFIERLLTDYRSESDAGLHGTVEWLLRKFGQQIQLAEIDAQLQLTEDQLRTRQDDSRQWYVNGQGQTYMILDAENEFQMGSPESEAGRAPDEDLHQRTIGRRFAILSTEVTMAQWRKFHESEDVFPPDQPQLKTFVPTEDCPMLALTWFEAAHYCNWLSEQEGIPEEQWCYETNDDGEYGPGMRVKENFLECTGYRLPTEAEWEFACRAGTETSRYYGSTEALLTEYAWLEMNGNHQSHPVGSLKPNDFGLFDMCGNAYEWCHDTYEGYVVDFNEEPPPTETSIISESERRVLRGGSFRNLTPNVRSASRVADAPDGRVLNHSFRPARTWDQNSDF